MASVEEYDLEDEEEMTGEYSPEAEAKLLEFARTFKPVQKGGIEQHIQVFFKDKMLHCGGKIPQKLLRCPRRISMATNYDICDAVVRAYRSLEKPGVEVQINSSGEPTDDIKLVAEILNLLARSGIPQQYAGGMLLLYLEFVEGVNIGPEGWTPSEKKRDSVKIDSDEI